jgi:hypothetical protein
VSYSDSSKQVLERALDAAGPKMSPEVLAALKEAFAAGTITDPAKLEEALAFGKPKQDGSAE